jgi:hypothetical protein
MWTVVLYPGVVWLSSWRLASVGNDDPRSWPLETDKPVGVDRDTYECTIYHPRPDPFTMPPLAVLAQRGVTCRRSTNKQDGWVSNYPHDLSNIWTSFVVSWLLFVRRHHFDTAKPDIPWSKTKQISVCGVDCTCHICDCMCLPPPPHLNPLYYAVN